MSKREESIPYILVHSVPWWVSGILAAVVYALMRWVSPDVRLDDPMLSMFIKALPDVAWMGAALPLSLTILNLWVTLLKRVNQSARGGIAKDRMSDGEPRHDTAPSCPVCARTMVRRTAKRGANAGADFWGCAQYPACGGTRSM
ncbi:hypothetical protein [Prosthecobacter sp.]|uniref:hypothetical protein n=1 Tax=Prosthecobacter sp. TaxID=1965333 RepID=UPI003783E618